MKKALLLTVIVISLVGYVNAQNKSSLFGFEGRVYLLEDKGDKGKEVNISLYDNNEKVSSYQTNRTGKFLLDVKRNKHYTVLFEKEGYITKSIIIKTYAKPNEVADIEIFKFDVILDAKEPANNYSLVDFPVSLIQLDREKGEFAFNVDYNESMIELKKRILERKLNIAATE